METIGIFEQGGMFVGCNYWASHAGTGMWRDWDEEIVRSDLIRLEKEKISKLRIFPIWSDFQPLCMHTQYAGKPREVRMNEDALPFTEEGRAGVDPVMIERFGRFLDLALEHRFALIVGLVTGWMSGRLFVPEMLRGKNVITDPFALRWEMRFVRYMVRRFKDHPAVAAWDLGNECNCMAPMENSDQLYLWTASIANAIRLEDPLRPIVSGMHGLIPQTVMEPSDQGELTDVLCTHPYPIFTPHCETDPMDRMKSALHAVAESRMCAGLGHKPCICEEIGTISPMIASEEVAAAYIRSVLMGLWAHDCRGLLWWCANEQSELTSTPYD